MFLWPCVSAMAVDLERDAKRQCCEPPAPHVSDVGALTDNVRKKALELLHRSFQETTDRSSDAKYAINVSDISETLELAVFKKFPSASEYRTQMRTLAASLRRSATARAQ